MGWRKKVGTEWKGRFHEKGHRLMRSFMPDQERMGVMGEERVGVLGEGNLKESRGGIWVRWSHLYNPCGSGFIVVLSLLPFCAWG